MSAALVKSNRKSGGSGGSGTGLAAMNSEQKAAVATLFGALQTYGPAPGAKKLLEREKAAAEHAISPTGGGGIYVTWRCESKNSDCTRIGPDSACFCGHSYSAHRIQFKKNSYPCGSGGGGGGCGCLRYKYIPTRPEEVGEYWLPRRPGFNIHTYAVKCKCGHTAAEHDPSSHQRKCRACAKCYGWDGHYACVVCDRKDSDHDVIWESTEERVARGAPVGADYMPFAELPQVAELVFNDKKGRTTAVGTRKQFAAGAGAGVAPPQPKNFRGLMPLEGGGGNGGSARAALPAPAASASGDDSKTAGALDWNDRPVRINRSATTAFDNSDLAGSSGSGSGSGSGGAVAAIAPPPQQRRAIRSKSTTAATKTTADAPPPQTVNHKTGFTPTVTPSKQSLQSTAATNGSASAAAAPPKRTGSTGSGSGAAPASTIKPQKPVTTTGSIKPRATPISKPTVAAGKPIARPSAAKLAVATAKPKSTAKTNGTAGAKR